MKAFVHIAVIIAIVTLGISPACAFINGSKSWIEICAADGSVKRVQVSSDEAPVPSESPSHDHEQMSDQCDFCFAFSHAKAIDAPTVILPHGTGSSYIALSSGTSVPLSARFEAFHPRAPPQLS